MPDLPASTPRQDARLAKAIAHWFDHNARHLPWRTSPRDPWLALMSEILLQQTQAARVAERFDAFASAFPTPRAMAAAPLDDVLALWSGLGYYRRAAMLHACAKSIVQEHGGRVPRQHDALLALPGVGRYTAGAVAAIVYNQPQPIVDGNVARVLLRLHGVEQSPDDPGVKNWTWNRASQLAIAAQAQVAAYSEGIMELGATLCTPATPRCSKCPCAALCKAKRVGAADRIPAPKARADRKPLSLSALIIRDSRGRVFLEQRPKTGLWAGLWQPPTVQRDADKPLQRRATIEALNLDGLVEIVGRAAGFQMATTHRTVYVRHWTARALNPATLRRHRSTTDQPAVWVDPSDFAVLGLGSVQRRMVAALPSKPEAKSG